MNWLEHILGSNWTVTPAGGSTGEAYYAQTEGKRLFLKRNSSPFLAVLSAEGIVPKLVWTKRLENGDVITAQEWLEGRELKTEEMKHPRVAALLSKIHHSSEMLDMLMRLGKHPLTPAEILKDLKENQKVLDQVDPRIEIHHAIRFLDKHVQEVEYHKHVVCHCDTNHNNWLLSSDDRLYLIDWDNAMVADPALDLGMLLYNYIPEDQWDMWLKHYGTELDDHMYQRMKWYSVSQSLSFIQWHQMRGEYDEAMVRLDKLKRIMKKHEIL
ncbi:phosphotransferase family protein [Halobacillus sp. ACCC02827]|uniref:phosphotransferase family protein n=1 Tax=unclassified Halobacillus TaxID=2636472 RepID=UPI0002F04EED|nr:MULTISPECIES: phosphotransferase family protein [Bacillaceae]WJE17703.1 phosphotransferase family protein [Halobacillus sp. ACCC02827]